MKFSKIHSAQINSIEGNIIDIEVDVSRGLHSFSLVGLAGKAVEESRDRVSAAIKNSSFDSPRSKNEKIVVSLAPAELKKTGSYHDLGIALAYLLAVQECDFNPDSRVFVGELSLDGSLKSIRGALSLVQAAKKAGFKEIFVPKVNVKEAALVKGVLIYGVDSLSELVAHLDENRKDHKKIKAEELTKIKTLDAHVKNDFKDIRGQELAKRALEIAAAGGHNVALYGPPGTGKTMLARAFAGILPKMNREELLEVTALHSISGKLDDSYAQTRPFRSPHHTSSYVAIVGGGAQPKPGEISLAHHGVLFLDEFPEFSKQVLESLRQPLEDRYVSISRAQGSARFPASFILVAALNPCPCGMYGSENNSCKCNAFEIARYQKKISGPIMDRIDMWIPVEHVEYKDLSACNEGLESSLDVKKRVQKVRELQHGRGSLNAKLDTRDIQSFEIDKAFEQEFQVLAKKLSLSPRAYYRVLKLARTIADMDNSFSILKDHLLEALQYRPKENLY